MVDELSSSKSDRSRSVAIAVVMAMLAMAVAFSPVRAEGEVPPSVDMVDLYASFRTADGLVIVTYEYFDLNIGTDEGFSIIQIGPGGLWRCSSSSYAGGAFPDISVRGVDRLSIDGAITASEFAFCSGPHPDQIVFSFDLDASTVIHKRSSSVSRVVKGEYPFLGGPVNFQEESWEGRDIEVTGMLNASPITTTQSNVTRYSWGRRVIDSSS